MPKRKAIVEVDIHDDKVSIIEDLERDILHPCYGTFRLDFLRPKSILVPKFLEHRFGCVMTEAKFNWLVVPDYISMDDVFKSIYDKLKAMRNYSGFSNPGYKLTCDFFIAMSKGHSTTVSGIYLRHATEFP